jgi:alpha-2-macroglobulin
MTSRRAEIASVFRSGEAWKLQTLTPIDALPEWGEPGPQGGTEGAPWAKDGPVLYQKFPPHGRRPKTMASAGDSHSPSGPASPCGRGFRHARPPAFSQSQFGVETLSSFGWWRQQDPDSAKGILEVDTLAEDECLAKTSDGVRRFKLPPGTPFHRALPLDSRSQRTAGDTLTQVFLNRRQYHKAREVLEQTIAKHGPGNNDQRKKLLKQITGNWGRFEPAETVSPGTQPKLPLVFRNATAHFPNRRPGGHGQRSSRTPSPISRAIPELDWQRVNPSQRIPPDRNQKLQIHRQNPPPLGNPAHPRDKHRDTRTQLEVPLNKAGAWWITGKITGRQRVSHARLDRRFRARPARRGRQAPMVGRRCGVAAHPSPRRRSISSATARSIWSAGNPLGRRMECEVARVRTQTDADGRTLLKPGDWDPHYQWLAIARARAAARRSSGSNPSTPRSPAVAEWQPRPELWHHRPAALQTRRHRHLKFYLSNVGYFEPEEDPVGPKTGKLTLYNGRGEEALKIENLKTDSLGAVETEVIIPKDAPLGTWRAIYQIDNQLPRRFRSRSRNTASRNLK